MNKYTLELTESELKVVANALKYTKAYKGLMVYEDVFNTIAEQVSEGISKYYVVQGIVDDGICRGSKTVLVRAKSQKHAVMLVKSYLEQDLGEIFTPKAVGEATRNYVLCEVLY